MSHQEIVLLVGAEDVLESEKIRLVVIDEAHLFKIHGLQWVLFSVVLQLDHDIYQFSQCCPP